MTWPEAVRKLVDSRASGRCEYCLLNQADAGFPHQIDHVISRKHGGTSHPDNLAFACYLCNGTKAVTSRRSIPELVSSCDYFTRARIVGKSILVSPVLLSSP